MMVWPLIFDMIEKEESMSRELFCQVKLLLYNV